MREARSETSELIKTASSNFQNHATEELHRLDNNLNNAIEESATKIENNIKDSLIQIHDETYLITKLTLSKILSVSVSDNEIKDIVDQLQPKVME